MQLKYVVKFQLLACTAALSIFAFIIGAIPFCTATFLRGRALLKNLLPDWNRDAAYEGKVLNSTLKCAYTRPGTTDRVMLSASDMLQQIDGTVTFGSVLAVFFPAVTGIMAGANISGDLKDPSYAIPKGTNLALIVSTAIYILLAIIVALIGLRSVPGIVSGTECPFGGIYHDYLFMARVSLWPPKFTGIFASTLSSAIASLVGAPRYFRPWPRTNFPGRRWKGRGKIKRAYGCVRINNSYNDSMYHNW